eukprot:TRINITY_DN159_c0_g1_i1.p1 TRINITY_DN159_c0_g1~~TRINITY_DN159_c0_g1_i1.p1  ORF type:complete len:724 (+),score=134.47 TRINITY_DN159_c0_g1_i1:194-2365(+)
MLMVLVSLLVCPRVALPAAPFMALLLLMSVATTVNCAVTSTSNKKAILLTTFDFRYVTESVEAVNGTAERSGVGPGLRIARVGGLAAPLPGAAAAQLAGMFSAGGFPALVSGSPGDATAYLEITIPVTDGSQYVDIFLYMAVAAGPDAPATYAVSSSVDGFASVADTFTAPRSEAGNVTADVSVHLATGALAANGESVVTVRVTAATAPTNATSPGAWLGILNHALLRRMAVYTSPRACVSAQGTECAHGTRSLDAWTYPGHLVFALEPWRCDTFQEPDGPDGRTIRRSCRCDCFLSPAAALRLRAASIASGWYTTCVADAGGDVKCWGKGSNGMIGSGGTASMGDEAGEMGDALSKVNLGTGRLAAAVTAGTYHTCALFGDETVKCWGWGLDGQLGYESSANVGTTPESMGDALPTVDLGTDRTAVVLSVGNMHTCAILDDQSLKCWGYGNDGQLGSEDYWSIGDFPGTMGDNLLPIDLGNGRSAILLSAGGYHTCVILDDQSVKCWGNGNDGRLGYNDTTNRGDTTGTMGDDLPVVALGAGRSAIQISAGSAHTCAILDDWTVKCWGSGADGRLGYEDTTNRGDTTGTMGDDLPAVDLGTGRSVHMISAGNAHTCVILDDQSVKCWGNGGSGRLGDQNTTNRGDTTGTMGDDLPPVSLGAGRSAIQISAGSAHTCAILDDWTVKCWGSGADGRLGYEDTTNRGDTTGTMGDDLPAVDLGSR